MTFEFEEQAPADILRLYDFVKTNKGIIKTKETIQISFVETTIIPAIKPMVFMDLIFKFSNQDLKYPYMITAICGEYIYNKSGPDKVRFNNKNLDSYLFMRDILIKDKIMYSKNYGAIINTILDIESYLKNKSVILDGSALLNHKVQLMDMV